MHKLREEMAGLAAVGLSAEAKAGFIKGAEYAYGITDYRLALVAEELAKARQQNEELRDIAQAVKLKLAVAEAEVESYKKHLRVYRRVFAYLTRPSVTEKFKARLRQLIMPKLDGIFAGRS